VSLEFDNFINPVNDAIYFMERPEVKNGIDLRQYLTLVKNNDAAISYNIDAETSVNILPSSTFSLPVNVEEVKKLGFVSSKLQPYLTDNMTWSLGKANLYKPSLIQLDIIAHNNWKRPIYFSTTLGSENYLNLKEFMQLEGLAYRLMPCRVEGARDGFVNSDVMYENLMNPSKTFWRELDNEKVNYNEFYTGSPVISSRIGFLRLATQLIMESDTEPSKLTKAKAVLERCLKIMPDKTIPYDQVSVSFVKPLIDVGEKQKGLAMADLMFKRADKDLEFYLNEPAYSGGGGEVNSNLYIMNSIVSQLKETGYAKEAAGYEAAFEKRYKQASQ
jgi:hypothetical protein